MSHTDATIKPGGNSFAALKNVAAMMGLVHRLADRGNHLPGLGVFHGFSGFGKTYAAIYAQNKTGGLRVEIGDSWTRRTFLQHVMRELGVNDPRGTVAELAERAIERLAEPGHPPLFIDEADKLVDKGMIELVREMHEAAQVPVILIGEETLPQKLMRSERTHNRVLEWVPAQPCDLEDARKLAAIFAPGLSISEKLLAAAVQASDGRARRLVVNFDRMAEWARTEGVMVLDEQSWAQGFYTGTPPARSGRRAA